MESGRFLLAVVLMIAVVVLTNILLPPPRPSGSEPAPAAPLPTTTRTDTPAPPPALPAQPAATPEPGGQLPADTIWANSPHWRFGFSTRGGALVSAAMLGYQSFAAENEGDPVELVPQGSALVHYRLRVGGTDVDLSSLPFQPTSPDGLQLRDGSLPGVLEMSYRDPDSGTGIQLTYTFRAEQYVFDVTARIIGADPTSSQLIIDLGPRLALNEAVPAEDERALALVTRSSETGIASSTLARLRNEQVVNGPLTWFALKSKYFVAAALRADTTASPFGGVIATPAGEHRANLAATLLPDRNGEFRFRLYLGPQEPDRLAALGIQDVTVFGWKFLQPILRPLGHAITWALLQMHRALGLGYGWVLILFGFLIRFVLWPLNATAMRSQLRNMEMQPRIKEIQARYKSDPEKLQKEMLRLYKEEGFNPMGGCLPMFLPFPVLITLFFVFQSTIEFRGVRFLWLPDLSLADPFYILPILLGLSMFIQQWLNMRTVKDQPAQMKYMTYIMPVFLTLLFLRFASGLNLYYASMNIASVPQQLQIMREKKRRFGTKQ
jgi:YidC/Oxa1 family membrane protein insertase